MIITDNAYTLNGGTYRRTVSDAGLMIRKVGTGKVYSEAVDLLAAEWTYEETDTPIPDSAEAVTGDEFLAMVEGAL